VAPLKLERARTRSMRHYVVTAPSGVAPLKRDEYQAEVPMVLL